MLLQLIRNKFSTQNERSTNALKNIILSFLYKGGNMVINIALVPITISFVNPSEYGIWLTISSIIAWFGISDIGFGNGLRNRFAEAVAKDDHKLARIYVSTTYISVTALMILMWILFFISNNFLNWSIILNVSPAFKDELSKVVLIIFSFFSIQFILRLIGTVLTANQQPGKAAGFDFLSNTLILLTIFFMIKININGNLVVLALVMGIFQLVVLIGANIWFFTKSLKNYSPSLMYFNKKYIKDLLLLGGKFFVIQISMIFVFQCTNIVIAQILSPDDVTVYNIAYKYYTIPFTIVMIVMTPFWSAFTDAYTKSDFTWMKGVVRKTRYYMVAVVIIFLLLYVFSDFLISKWIGNVVLVSRNVSLAMMVNILLSTISSVFIVFINGIGKVKIQMLIYILFTPIFIPLSILLGKVIGLAGIILAGAIINIAFIIFSLIQINLILNQKAEGKWNQ